MTYIGALQGQGSSGASSNSLSQLLGSGGGISGLASGINTDSIVQGLVQAAQVPLVQLMQQRQIAQWKEQQYQQVNNSLSALQNSVSNLKLQSTFLQQTVSSSASSLVTGSASPLTPAGAYNVAVSQLAQGATISSSQVLSANASYGDIPLNTLSGGPTSSFTLTVNGQAIAVDPTKDTINSVLAKITSDTQTGVTGFYDSNAGKVVLQTSSTGTGAKIQISSTDTSNFLSSMLHLNPTSSVQTTISTAGLATEGFVEINGYKFDLKPASGTALTASTIAAQISLESGKTGVTATGNDTTGTITLSGQNLYSPISVNDPSNYLGLGNLSGANRETATSAFSSSAATSTSSVTINGQTIAITSTTTLSDVEAAINGNSGASEVKAMDDGSGHIILSSNGAINVSDPSNFLGLQGTSTVSVADNAVYSVNGFTSTSSTNTANYNGLSLNLESTTASPVSLTVSSNVDAVVKTITDFVQQYNQTLQFIQGLYNQQPNRDYLPLTTTQASQMTQTQINEWNGKAQSGLLNSDDLLNSTMSGLESATSTTVSGQTQSILNGTTVTFNSLSSIGISAIDPMGGVSSGAIAPGVTSTGWNTYGLLQINTDQLTAAIQADPQAVMRLFTNNPSLSGSTSTMGTGVSVQMYNSLVSSVSNLTQQAGTNPAMTPPATGAASTGLAYALIDPNADLNTLFGPDSLDISSLGQSISGMDTQATDMQQNIDNLRQRYQNQFANMETVLSQLSTQSNYLSGMMGGSSSSTGG